jgi:aldehyde dehydrogenase (NAD+)
MASLAPLAASDAPTTPDALGALFQAQQDHAPAVRQTDAAQRRAKISRLRQGILARRDEVRAALHADFRKAPVEVDLSEVKAVADQALFAMDNLEDWMAPERVKTPPLLAGTRSEIRYEPRGVVLILSPWNYPFNLTLGPLIAAIAAGNCAVVKPSEYTPNASAVMREMIAELFEPREIVLVEGDKTVAQTLLDLPFDHFYFTGSPTVGKIVMRAAAEHLSSVTLELGGKSPTVVDRSADLDDAAAKVAWGKFANVGQTCIAPDHVYVHSTIHEAFVDRVEHYIRQFYGATPAEQRASEDYGRLVNDAHFQHIKRLFDEAVDAGATVAAGGQHESESRYFAPTVLTDVPQGTSIMDTEIFGPVLPVLPFRALDDVIRDINRCPNPLAAYIFSNDDAAIERFLSRTSVGGSAVNEVLLHYMNPHLPFGGAGHSGIGRGNGVHAFREFSNERSVLRRTAGAKWMRPMYPPYGRLARTLADWVVRWF